MIIFLKSIATGRKFFKYQTFAKPNNVVRHIGGVSIFNSINSAFCICNSMGHLYMHGHSQT